MPLFRSGKPSWILGQLAGQAFGAGVTQNVVWDATLWEDPIVFDGISTVTVDRPGLYELGFIVTRATVGTSSTALVRLRINSVTYVANQAPGASGSVTYELTTMAKLETGDTVEVQALLHNTAATTTTPAWTKFHGARVGPERWT